MTAHRLLSIGLLALACLVRADERALVLSSQGSSIGRNVYDLEPDGTFRSTTDIAAGSTKLHTTLSGRFEASKVSEFHYEIDVSGSVQTLDYADGVLKIKKGDKTREVKVGKDATAMFSNYHPVVGARLLNSLSSEGGSVKIFVIEAGTVVDGIYKVSRVESNTVARLSIAGTSIELAYDSKGVFLGERVPGSKFTALPEKGPSPFIDPLSKYPELSQPTFRTKRMTNVMAPMRDGVRLAAEVILPDGPGPFPTILVRTPYGRQASALEGDFWASRGYAFVAQDCRGRDGSEGVWDPFINERRDGKDTIDWIAAQPWSNKRVGMIGGSYLGYVQWAAAVEHPEALKCIVPQVSPPDAFTNIPYDMGVPMLLGGVWWANIVRDKDTHMERAAQPIANVDGLLTLPLPDVAKAALGSDAPFYKAWLERDTMAKWQGYDTLKDVAGVRIPTLSISGWWDGDEIGTQLMWAKRRAAGIRNQWLIYGPWEHGFNVKTEFAGVDYGEGSVLELDSLYLRWFDTWLKGKQVGLDKIYRVRAFLTGENRWLNLGDWPDKSYGAPANYFLSNGKPANGYAGGGILTHAPVKSEPDHYVYDPSSVNIPEELRGANLMTSDRVEIPPSRVKDDTLVYQTEVLSKALRVAGPISLDFYFSTTARDADFFAALVDVDAKGVWRLIGQFGKVRGSFLHGFDERRPLVPGKTYHANLKLWDFAHSFLPGHRMALIVKSDLFPAFARNPGTAEPDLTATKLVKATQTIYHDPNHPSALKFWYLP